jgi:hypothetical protein
MMKKIIYLVPLLVIVVAGFMHASRRGTTAPLLVLFSKDRPLQLYALLESIERNVSGDKTVAVLYHAAQDQYQEGYNELIERFPGILWYAQSRDNPRADFKTTLIDICEKHPSDYLMFAVDDMVVTLPVDCATLVNDLEKTGAYGLYLRLGDHVDTCYMARMYSGLPGLRLHDNRCYLWRFDTGRGDWRYPHTTDMTLYRMADVLPALKSLNYHSPNTLEAQWSSYQVPYSRDGLCYKTACVVNIPLNLVQKDFANNRSLALYSPEELHTFFVEGKKIAIDPLMGVRRNTVHIEYEPTFVAR